MRALALLILIACTACTASHSLTECRGSFAQANPSKWTPAPGELTGRPK